MKVPVSVGDGDGNGKIGKTTPAIWTITQGASCKDTTFKAPKDGFFSIKPKLYHYYPGHTGNGSRPSSSSGSRVILNGRIIAENLKNIVEVTTPIKKGDIVVYQITENGHDQEAACLVPENSSGYYSGPDVFYGKLDPSVGEAYFTPLN